MKPARQVTDAVEATRCNCGSPCAEGVSPSSRLARCPETALRLWVPLGYTVFFAGLVISIVVRCSGRSFRLEDAILSDLLSRVDNPRGFLVADCATASCGFLLLPVASLFRKRLNAPRPWWTVLGAWLYRLGLFAAIAIGITTPFQQPYIPIHIYLAFLAFMGVVAGLAVCLAAAACAFKPSRGILGALALAGINGALLLFLAYLFMMPSFFSGRRGWLAICEWVLCGSIALSTVALVVALSGPGVSIRHSVPHAKAPSSGS